MTDRLITHLRSLWPKWNPSDEQAADVCRALSMARVNAKDVLRDAIAMHREDKTDAPNAEWIMRHYTALRETQRKANDARKAKPARKEGTSFGHRPVPCRVKYPNGFANSVMEAVRTGEFAETSARKKPKGASDE